MNEPVYLDFAATTPVDARVLAAMQPYFSAEFGNPSSVHRWGQQAERALERARRDVAAVLNCQPSEIIFTSGGSEADNLALRGAALAAREARGAAHLITSPIEHSAVLSTLRQLRDHFGFRLTILPVDSTGLVAPDELARAIQPDTALVSIMYACNEIGSIEPLAELAAVCGARGVLLHTDAVQAASQLDLDVQRLGVDYLALGAHKFYGPKGVGALYVREGRPLLPTQTGGAHENGLRAGTSNVPYIAGLAAALKITAAERETHNAHFTRLRDRLITGVLASVSASALTGHPSQRLPNHASFVIPGLDGNELLMHLDLAGIGVSSGSACKTGDPEPSEVLLALGLPREVALGSLRVTVGRQTTDAHVDRLLAVLPGIVEKMRATAAVGVARASAMSNAAVRVVVAMSGGVDSSVAAALLKRQGYDVVGLMLRLWGEPDKPGSAYNRCCSPDSIAQARRVAEIVDIPFYVLDAQAPFKAHVVDFFVDSYVAGVTPNPCIECNRHIRWDYLLKRALSMEATYLATGHYARIQSTTQLPAPNSQLPITNYELPLTNYQLLKGLDPLKDQSYVLSVMGQSQLAHALFPIGEHTKPAIRQLARDFGLPVAERAESQDLCFLADNDYRRFIREHAGSAIRPGPIVRGDGRVVGQHTGLADYTIGQRKGIGVSGPEALYVTGTRAADNALVVGPAEELGGQHLVADRVNWISGAAPREPIRAEVKIRYKAAPAWATVSPLPGSRAEVIFEQRLRDISPGQSAVFYQGEVCLGGGIIMREAA